MRRRDVLVGAGRAVIGLALISVTASACSLDDEPEVDPLEAPYQRAMADAELARSAATAAKPNVATALTQVATEREQHATALANEITRATGRSMTTTETTSATTANTTETTPSSPPPTAAQVTKELLASAKSAAEAAISLSGYRAGLLGSIAAACTASATVTLPAPKAAS